MSRKTLLITVTCAALLGAGSAAAAQGRGGGVAGSVGGGLGGGIGGGAGGGIGVGLGGGFGGGIGGIRADGGLGVDLRANTHGIDTRSTRRVRSRAPAKASATAIANANSNSVLAGSTVSGGALAGLTAGMAVEDASGTTIGTVERIETSANGVVRNILVRLADGQRIIPLASDSLTVSGQTATATAVSVSSGANRRN